ncbi:hypothetical protein ACS5PK_04240 [Roseateles sp. DB2]|uniref:hypothetical protein n=1 Tax=Roseateles sp. DB2 TaxID=3453717 RepID=UPI003EEF2BAD
MSVPRFLPDTLLPRLLCLSLAAGFTCIHAQSPDAGPAVPGSARPLSWELSWTPLRTKEGGRMALAGASALLAVNEEWGLGPTVYASAKGNYGGIFMLGLTGQRRWRLSPSTHLAAGLFVGGGGGLSSDVLRFGGGFMWRPELSLRTEVGPWYTGVGLSRVMVPGGNIADTQLSFMLGRQTLFHAFDPGSSGRQGASGDRGGLGFDEMSLVAGAYAPSRAIRRRSGEVMNRKVGLAGAALRQYISPSAWWGLEAAGGAKGGADGYMEVLAALGQDWALGRSGFHLGGQAALGLAGGGDVDTGSGWLMKIGPSLRWQSAKGWGWRLDAGWAQSRGAFHAPYARFSLDLPLEPVQRRQQAGAIETGTVQEQDWLVSLQRLRQVPFKDGSKQDMTQQGLIMTRGLGEHLYGLAQAGTAIQGKAGAYAYGLLGLGLRSQPFADGRWRVGAEILAGAGGGGGVQLGGGALRQTEVWAQWQGQGELSRLRLRAGLGQWGSLRGRGGDSTQLNLAVGYAWGSL